MDCNSPAGELPDPVVPSRSTEFPWKTRFAKPSLALTRSTDGRPATLPGCGIDWNTLSPGQLSVGVSASKLSESTTPACALGAPAKIAAANMPGARTPISFMEVPFSSLRTVNVPWTARRLSDPCQLPDAPRATRTLDVLPRWVLLRAAKLLPVRANRCPTVLSGDLHANLPRSRAFRPLEVRRIKVRFKEMRADVRAR